MLDVGEWDSLRDMGVVLLNSERGMSVLTRMAAPIGKGHFLWHFIQHRHSTAIAAYR